MNSVKLNSAGIHLLLLILASAVAVFEYGGFFDRQGALLLTLAFWSALIQGAVAVAAVTLLVRAKWIASLQKELLALYPLLLFLALLFALLWPRIDLYSWSRQPTAWLNQPFFMGRNVLALLLTYIAGRRLALASGSNGGTRDRQAVGYLLLFVLSQSLVGFDWVMSAAYPWYSTMFGLYFFTEALYAGIALAGLLFWLFRRQVPENTAHLQDVGRLLFGFSILWAGLFFAQFLLLWYGNLPEEVHYIIRRTEASPYRELCWLFLLGLFLVPFVALLSGASKRDNRIVAAVSLAVLAGLFAERLLFLLPVVPQHGGGLLVYNLVFLGVGLLILQSRDRLLPEEAAGKEKD